MSLDAKSFDSGSTQNPARCSAIIIMLYYIVCVCVRARAGIDDQRAQGVITNLAAYEDFSLDTQATRLLISIQDGVALLYNIERDPSAKAMSAAFSTVVSPTRHYHHDVGILCTTAPHNSLKPVWTLNDRLFTAKKASIVFYIDVSVCVCVTLLLLSFFTCGFWDDTFRCRICWAKLISFAHGVCCKVAHFDYGSRLRCSL